MSGRSDYYCTILSLNIPNLEGIVTPSSIFIYLAMLIMVINVPSSLYVILVSTLQGE